MQPPATESVLVWGSPRARWVVGATVLGSALTFIDATVVNIALPRLGRDLGSSTVGLTWVVNAYTLTLAALVLLGGSLGDRLGRRRVFTVGVVLFAVASAACGLAPNTGTLIAARAVQGVGGALLTPASLAILQASFGKADRPKAIGAWSGLTGVAAAVGPFLGGWLVEFASWRWVFLVNLPVTVAVLLVVARHVPESSDPDACPELDGLGAGLLAGSLGAVTYGLTAFSEGGAGTGPATAAVVGGLVLGVLFVLREHRAVVPLLPLGIFRSEIFVATNVVTLLVYAALGALFFALGVVLQVGAGFSPVAAGLALMPVTVIMLLFSARAGALMARVGPRVPMTLGTTVAAVGVALLVRIDADTSYLLDVLGPATLLGAGLTLFVGPLTATVLGAVPDAQAGLASGVNNAVARTAGLLAVAALPLVGGLGGEGLLDPDRVLSAFTVIAWGCAGLFAGGALLSALFVPAEPPQEDEDHHAHEPRRHCSVTSPPVEAEESHVLDARS